jgi:Holliday junction resolvase
MTASGYRRGADLERAAKHYLEDNGYYVIKSAGSKGVADLVAIKPGETLYVQCKLDGYLLPDERVRFRQAALKSGAVPVVARWVKEGRAARQLGWRELTSMGPAGNRDWTPDHGMQSHPQAQEHVQ